VRRIGVSHTLKYLRQVINCLSNPNPEPLKLKPPSHTLQTPNLKPKPEIPNPKIQTQIPTPKPQAPNTKPQILNPKPQTTNPKPQIPDPEP
jgi:hypothetical protein